MRCRAVYLFSILSLQTPSFAFGAGQLPDGAYLDGAYASGRYLRGELDHQVRWLFTQNPGHGLCGAVVLKRAIPGDIDSPRTISIQSVGAASIQNTNLRR